MHKRIVSVTSVALLAAVSAAHAQQPSPGKQKTEQTPAAEGYGVIEDHIFIRKIEGAGPAIENLGVGGGIRRMAVERASTFEFINSELGIPGNLVKGAPYSAEASTETIQTLGDGNRIVHKSTSNNFRDSEGRTRRETSIGAIGPWASKGEDVRVVFIHDPVENVSYTLNEKDKTARKASGRAMVLKFSPKTPPGESSSEDVVFETAPDFRAEANPTPGTRVRDRASTQVAKQESLGVRVIEGVKAEGTRVTNVIPAGEIGNERAIEIVFERWYSPELQTVVLTRHVDPRMGETVFKLVRIRRDEPARSLFEVPSDYTLVNESLPEPRPLRRQRQQ